MGALAGFAGTGASATAPGLSWGRFTVTRTEKSNRRFCSLLAAVIVVALLSISSGLTSHSEL